MYRKGYVLTEGQMADFHLVLQFAIPQMKNGKPKTLAKKLFNNLEDVMFLKEVGN